MNLQNLRQFILEGIEHGATISEIKHKAVDELGAAASDFDQAYDLIILGDISGQSLVSEPVLEPAQAPVSEPAAVSEPEMVVAPIAPFKPAPFTPPAYPVALDVKSIPTARPSSVSLFQPQVMPSVTEEAALSTRTVATAPLKKRGGFFNWFRVHKLAAAVVVIVALLSGVGYVGATMLMAPNVNEVRGLIFQKLMEMDTVVYQGSVEGEVSTEATVSLESLFRDTPTQTLAKISNGRVAGSQNTKVRLDFNGAADVRDIDSPKTEFSFTLTAEGFVVGMETKTIDDEIFLKLTQIPDFGVMEINELINQWLRIDYSQIQEEIGGAEPDRDEGLTLEQKQRLLRIFSNSNVFKIAERIGSEEIDGKATHHYRFMIDEDGLIVMLEEMAKVFGSTEPFNQSDKETFKEWFDSAGGDIWIAKKDYAPVKMSFELMMRSISEAPVSGRLSFDMNFKKYNEEISIEAPYPFKDLAEVLKEYQADESAASRDARRVSDIQQLMLALDMYNEEYKSYPRTLDQMISADFQSFTEVPLAPQPPDGKCTPVQNEYIYKVALNNQNYILSFCLGEEYLGYKPGVHTATPDGIK